jgi:hypothetical protein
MPRFVIAVIFSALAAFPSSAKAAETMGWQLRNACALMPSVANGATSNVEDVGYAYECLGYFEALMDTQLYLKAHGRRPTFCYTDAATPFQAAVNFVPWVSERPELLNGKAGFAALPYLAEIYPCP